MDLLLVVRKTTLTDRLIVAIIPDNADTKGQRRLGKKVPYDD